MPAREESAVNLSTPSPALTQRAASTLVSALFGALLLCTPMTQAATLAVGQPAPPLTARTLDGGSFDLKESVGHVVIVNFWASWCSPCRKEMPTMETYYQQHQVDGLRIIAINMDDAKNAQVVRDIMRDFSFPAALAPDAQYSGYGRIWRLPMTFVIDRQGVLRKDGSVGDPKIDLPLLESLVTPLLGETTSK
jgi:thiol-disulfide isomerase/thioredoxin